MTTTHSNNNSPVNSPIHKMHSLHVDGSSVAFQERLNTERPRLIRLCAAILQDREAAEDVAQEALLEAWRNASKLRGLDALSPLALWHCTQRLRTLAAQTRKAVGAPQHPTR